MLGKYKGRWAFLSKTTGKPLRYAPGSEKPSQEWVNQQEKRIQYFKHLHEQYGMGGAGQAGAGAYAEDAPRSKKKVKSLKQVKENSTPSQLNTVDGPDQGITESGPKKKKKIKEAFQGGAEAGTSAGEFMAYGESEPKKRKIVHIIKNVMKDKYQRKPL